MNQYFTEHPKCIKDAMVHFNTFEYLYGSCETRWLEILFMQMK